MTALDWAFSSIEPVSTMEPAVRVLTSFVLTLCVSCVPAAQSPAPPHTVETAPVTPLAKPLVPQLAPITYPPFRSLALGPDGQLLACAPDRGVVLFDLPNQTMRDLSTVDDYYYREGYSPGTSEFRACGVAFQDGIPTALADYTTNCLVRWDVAKGKATDTAGDNASRFSHTTFTPDGSRVLAVSVSGLAWEWRVADGALLHHWAATPYATAVAATPDGARLWIASRARSTQWDLATQQAIRSIDTPGLDEIVSLPTGTRGISHNGKSMWLWDLDRHRPMHIFGPSQSVRAYRFSPDASRLLTSAYGPVSVWNAAKGGLLHSLTSPVTQGWVYGLDVSPDGKRALTGSGENAMELWDLDTGKSIAQFPHPAYVSFVGFLPDGHHAVSISGRDYHGGATARVWDLDSGEALRSFQVQKNMAEIAALSPHGEVLVTSGDGDHTLKMWSTQSGELLRTLHSPLAGIQSISVTPDGSRTITGDANGVLRVWRTTGLKLERSVLAHPGPVVVTAVSDSGRWALTSARDGTTRLWDLESGALLRDFGQGCTAVAFDRLEHAALVALPNSTVVEWNIPAGKQIGAMKAGVACGAIATTPDGLTVLTGHTDGSLRTWSRATYQATSTRQGRPVPIVGLVASSSVVASAAQDGTLGLWRLRGHGGVTLTAGNRQWIAYTGEGDYLGSEGAASLVTVGSGGRGTLGTWDKAGRRPERVLDAVGLRAH